MRLLHSPWPKRTAEGGALRIWEKGVQGGDEHS
jgi:hypothetical protein